LYFFVAELLGRPEPPVKKVEPGGAPDALPTQIDRNPP
jgi:hypothetical protein